jgi:hypothetical protein
LSGIGDVDDGEIGCLLPANRRRLLQGTVCGGGSCCRTGCRRWTDEVEGRRGRPLDESEIMGQRVFDGEHDEMWREKKIPAKTFPRVRDQLVRISPRFLSIIEVGLWGV